MGRKNKVIRYSKIYNKRGKKKGVLFHVLVGLVLFVIIALVVYLIASGVNSYLNRDRVTEIEIPQVSSENSEPSSASTNSSEENIEQSETLVAVEIPVNKLNNSKYITEFIEKAKNDKKNAIIVTLKNESGNLLYSSQISEAKSWGAILGAPLDAKKVAEEIKAAGLIPIARVSAFKDQISPHASRDNSYIYSARGKTTYMFRNSATGRSEKWLNPYKNAARKYICDIVSEIAQMGYEHVLLDNVSFPSVEFNSQVDIGSDGKNKSDILKQFFKELDSTGVSYIISYNWKILSEEKLSNVLYGGNLCEYGVKKQALLIDFANKPFSGNDREIIKKSVEAIRNANSNISIFPIVVNFKNGNNSLDEFKTNGVNSMLNLNK